MFKLTDLHIKAGEKSLFKVNGELFFENGAYALVGRNGSGKTTFFNTIIGLNGAYDGSILLNNQELSSLGMDFSKQIAIVKTHPQIYGDHTVEDVLWLGRLPYQNLFGLRKKEDQNRIEKVLHELGIIQFRTATYSSLSDGEKQLVMIGRALVQDTPVLLLDEPLAFLDLVNQKEVLEVLKRISQFKVLIFSTHHIHLLNDVCDNVILIDEKVMKMLGEGKDYSSEIKSIFELN